MAVDPVDGMAVLGFYTLAPVDVDFEQVPAEARPRGGGRYPIGGIRLARLAASKTVQGQGVGGALFIAAARRCIRASTEIGGTMLVIDSKDEFVAAWYMSYGAIELPGAPLTLMVPYSVFTEVMKDVGNLVL